jgi:hypothetical protein
VADPHVERPDDGERGSAVVDFVLVSVLIVMLLLAVLQVAVYVHVLRLRDGDRADPAATRVPRRQHRHRPVRRRTRPLRRRLRVSWTARSAS